MTIPDDLQYAIGGPFTPEQVAFLAGEDHGPDEGYAHSWSARFDMVARRYEAELPAADQLPADTESVNVITSDWVMATVTYPSGRSITANWAYEVLEREVLTNPGTTAHIL